MLDTRELFSAYPAFFYLRTRLARFGLGRLNIAVTFLFLALIAAAAAADETYILNGPDVGLLEHPAIFAFLATQCILPYAALKGAQLFLALPDWGPTVLRKDFLDSQLPDYEEFFKTSAERKNNIGRIVYRLLVAIGFGAFAWNSISNQAPLYFVGFDFWDSINHPWGYAVTRVYKCYMWVVFFPALVHVEIMMLVAMRRLLISAARRRSLILEPFHPDDCGGVRSFMDTILIPLLPALAISSLLALCAVVIHRRVDVTTGGALLLVCLTFLALYFMLAAALRSAILAEKKRQLGLIADLQNASFFNLLDRLDKRASPEDVSKTIDSLSAIAQHVKCLPNWPQLRFVVKAVTLAGSSPVFTWLAGIISQRTLEVLGLGS